MIRTRSKTLDNYVLREDKMWGDDAGLHVRFGEFYLLVGRYLAVKQVCACG